MKKALHFFIFLVFSLSLQSQTTFQKTYGTLSTDEVGYDVKTTEDGGALLLIGVAVANSDSFDPQLVKVNAEGNVVWEKDYPSSDYESNLRLEQHPSGDYIICANAQRASGERYLKLMMVDKDSGDEIWSNTYDAILYDFTINSDGEIISLVFFNGRYQMVIFDEAGILVDTNFLNPDLIALESIRSTQDGGFIFAGTGTSVNPFNEEMLLYKTDSNGNEEWTTLVGNLVEEDKSNGGIAFQTSDGGYVIAGQISNSQDLIAKTDNFGNILWINKGNVSTVFEQAVWWKGMEIADGDYVFLSNVYNNGYVIRIDAESGQTVWSQTIDYGKRDSFYGMEEQQDGNLWLFGVTNSINGTGNDALLTIFSKEGIGLNIIAYGERGNDDFDRGSSSVQTVNGDFLLVGQTLGSNNRGDTDWYLLSINGEDGELNWKKTFDYREGDDNAYHIAAIPSGGYALYGTGLSEDTTSLSIRMRLTKIDEFGATVWTHTYDSLMGTFNFGMTPTEDGGFGIIGRSIESDKLKFYKLNESGSIQWSRDYDGRTSFSMKKLREGGYMVLSSGNRQFTSTGLYVPYQLIKTDEMGEEEWYYGLEDSTAFLSRAFDGVETQEGNFAFTGLHIDGMYDGSYMYISMVDEAGNFLWKKEIGSETAEYSGYGAVETIDGNLVFLGTKQHRVLSDIREGMLIKTDKEGNEIWRKFYGGEIGKAAIFYDLQLLADGGFLMTGSVYTENSTDVYLVRTDSEGNTMSVNVFNPSLQYNFNIAPNPNKGQFQLSFEGNIGGENLQLSILDLVGRQLEERVIPPITQQVDLTHLPSGTYFVKLGNGEQFSTKRVVIE